MTGNCGFPDGAIHQHVEACYQAGRRDAHAERTAEKDHNAERLLLRIEHAIYANAEGVDREERATIMADVRAVLVSERVICSPGATAGGDPS